MSVPPGAIVLTGRTAVVTGAGGGVGKGIALALGAAGANVVVAARRSETGEQVAEEIRARGGSAICVTTDVSREGDVEAMVAATVQRFGGLDVMIHNALSRRATDHCPLIDVTADLFDDVVSVASRASFLCVKAALPYLKPGRGRVVLLLAHGGVRGHGGLSIYGIAKGMQRGNLKSLTWELGERGIAVNAIVPLALSEGMEAHFATRPGEYERQAKRAALGYIGKPEEDIGGAAVFLSSDAAKYIAGQTIFVDGGTYML
jgi:3-oxoacyl-[acyl-carrier protein] reductase